MFTTKKVKKKSALTLLGVTAGSSKDQCFVLFTCNLSQEMLFGLCRLQLFLNTLKKGTLAGKVNLNVGKLVHCLLQFFTGCLWHALHLLYEKSANMRECCSSFRYHTYVMKCMVCTSCRASSRASSALSSFACRREFWRSKFLLSSLS